MSTQRKSRSDVRKTEFLDPHINKIELFYKNIREITAGTILIIIVLVLAVVLIFTDDSEVKKDIIGLFKAFGMLVIGFICGMKVKE